MQAPQMPPSVAIETAATEANFDPASYLRANPDVAAAVARGSIESAAHHFCVRCSSATSSLTIIS